MENTLTVCLGHEGDNQDELDARPDEQDVIRPPPAHARVDEAAQDRTNGGSEKLSKRVQQHRGLQFIAAKQVPDGPARDGEERTAGESVKEAGDDHGGDVAGNSLGNDLEDVQGPGDEIDRAAAKELAQGPEEHGADADAEYVRGDAEGRDEARPVEFGIHLGVGGAVDGAGSCAGIVSVYWCKCGRKG